MKTKKLISIYLWLFLLGICQIKGQPPTISLATPKQTSFYGYLTPEIYDYQDKLDWGAAYAAAYPDCDEQGTATTTSTYNCHSYAWNKIEGGPTCWIGYSSSLDEDVYWTDGSYVETSEPYASKISYYADNHSAIQTSTQGWYISKWGDKVLMLHARDDGPASYQMGYRKYYRLNPGINGSTSTICDNDQRVFSSNMSIPGSTYTWTRETGLLDYISGSGTTSYTVEANGNSGAAYVGLQITTPSGEVRSASNKRFWVGIPPLPVITSSQPYTIYVSGDITLYDENAYNYGGILQNYTDWTWSSDGVCCLYDMTAGYQFYYGAYPGTVRIRTYSENSCGSTYWSEPVYVEVIEEEEFMLSPNPAFKVVKVSISASKSPTAADENSTLSDYNLDIYDLRGTLYKTFKKIGREFIFDVTDLREGTYIVKIKIGTKNISKPLIIKH